MEKKKRENGKLKLRQPGVAINPRTQIAMHFGIAHMRLPGFWSSTSPTTAFEQVLKSGDISFAEHNWLLYMAQREYTQR